jgi:hypothetical protein
MAREAGAFTEDGYCTTVTVEVAERFAALISEHERNRIFDEAKHIIKSAERRGAMREREECAKVCEWLGTATNGTYERNAECAAAIRARISHA